MRNREDMNYGNFNSRQRYDHDNQRYDRNRHQPGDRYRVQQEQGDWQENRHRQPGNYRPTEEDFYNEMYDIANYSGQPRHEEYGLYHGTDDELESIKPMPLQEGPYYGRQRYNYSLGYNPNFDNPEEGDMYRDFDSRGNHGFRHDAAYGNADEFRDFGNDHYGRYDRTNRGDFDEENRYGRY